MKRFCLILAIICLASAICGCGNMSLGLGNYSYDKIHIDTHHYSGCLCVEKWYDNSTGIEVLTKEYGSVYLSEGTYFLISGDCPLCESQTDEGGE